MTKLLAHTCNNRTYQSLINGLSKHIKILGGSLHDNIFDTYSKYNPTTIILPIHEYTQEFHEFVNTFKNKVDINIFVGEILHSDLIKYCDTFNIKTIRRGDNIGNNVLSYQYLYDNEIFYNMDSERQEKILVILNDQDNSIIEPILYPNSDTRLVLINNPNFKHPQNIGLADGPDLAILFNQFTHLIDLTNSHTAEAQACGIKNLSISGDIIDNIKNSITIPKITNIEEYTVNNFVNDKLLKFIGV